MADLVWFYGFKYDFNTFKYFKMALIIINVVLFKYAFEMVWVIS